MNSSKHISNHDSPTIKSHERLRQALQDHQITYELFPSTHDDPTHLNIKTLIWEASSINQNNELERRYITTVLRMQDRVDKLRLKNVIYQQTPLQQQQQQQQQQQPLRIQLHLADQQLAERLTGFQTGTIPPFGHIVPMIVFVDETLANLDESVMVRTGSGVAGYNLNMTVAEIMMCCRTSCADLHVQSISEQTNDNNNNHLPMENVIPNTEKQKQNIWNASKLPIPKSQKPLAKKLRDAAGKLDRVEEVRLCIQIAGSNLPDIMTLGRDGNFTKNALHLAAWKGDLESIVLLTEAGHNVNRDFFNEISIGEGNYGKTPIHYSITQERDDAVKVLLNLGANLLIVNNKGQSACSLAPAHLSHDTCQELYRIEEEQLRSGKMFTNYRVTHSDGKKYGDLDPRFTIDDYNLGEDILEDVESYQNMLPELPTVCGIPVGTNFQRVLRKTTLASRSTLACEQQTPKPQSQVVLQSERKSAHDILVHKLRSCGVTFCILNVGDEQSSLVSVKTQIWKAKVESEGEDESFFFATAINELDDVDQGYLRAALQSHLELQLELANTVEIARVTGFCPDSLPPFGHTIPLKLYLDEGLLYNISQAEQLRIPAGTANRNLQMGLSELMRFCSTTATIYIRSLVKNHQTVKGTDVFLQAQAIIGDDSNNGEPFNTHKPKSLAKRLRDVAGKEGKADELRQCIEEAGDSFPDLLYGGKDGSFTKSAMHNAAWKGDLESVVMLVEAGNKFGRDLLNEVSTGDGNYGKTPLFYAITQVRIDHARKLIALGASLLVVNNKGQTPCSLAPSRFPVEFCKELYQLEEDQLRSGGEFVNYRLSHSDGKKYGDLDPRFSIDSANMGDDIREELDNFYLAVQSQEKVRGVPVGDRFPRVVRVTTEELRYYLACQRWGRRPLPRRLIPVAKVSIKRDRKEKTLLKPIIHNQLDLDILDVMKLTDLMDKSAIVVDTWEGVVALLACIDHSIAEIEELKTVTQESSLNCERDLASVAWGLDSEWRPKNNDSHDSPVATLQLSSARQAFVLDMQTLCQKSSGKDFTGLSKIECVLSNALSKLFTSKDIPIIGFAIAQDLSKLAQSFPHMPCFRLFEVVVDYQTVAIAGIRDSDQPMLISLQRAVALSLGKKLDKAEQCSNWEQRPLSSPQIEYAALDAAVVRHLFWNFVNNFLDTKDEFNHYFPNFRQTIRTTFLGEDNPSQGEGNCRALINRNTSQTTKFVKQSWKSENKSPDLPSLLSFEEKEAKPTSYFKCLKEQNGENPSKVKGKPKKRSISLKNIPGDLNNLPPAGSLIGYTKDSCVDRTVGKAVVNSIAQDFGFRYNRWGGIIEMQNCFLLFVNCNGLSKDWKYSNQFFDGGRQVSFSANAEKDQEIPFLHDLGALDSSGLVSEDAKTILLFARPNSNSKYLCCGPCLCLGWKIKGNKYDLRLKPMDYATLVGDYDQVTQYLEMVILQERDLQ